ncbi:MAG: M67 family metallopeptidase [Chloroflexota bacterium]|jgi:proteasome lid subunit RPN8/RPN11
MAELILPVSLYENVLEAAVEGYPEEICGLIAGKEGKALRHYPVENIYHSQVRYEMEPIQQVKVMIAMEEEGLELLAIYHSHPHGPARPSATDVAQAYYPDVIQLIISLEDRNQPHLAAFMIDQDRVRSVNWIITPDSGN